MIRLRLNATIEMLRSVLHLGIQELSKGVCLVRGGVVGKCFDACEPYMKKELLNGADIHIFIHGQSCVIITKLGQGTYSYTL